MGGPGSLHIEGASFSRATAMHRELAPFGCENPDRRAGGPRAAGRAFSVYISYASALPSLPAISRMTDKFASVCVRQARAISDPRACRRGAPVRSSHGHFADIQHGTGNGAKPRVPRAREGVGRADGRDSRPHTGRRRAAEHLRGKPRTRTPCAPLAASGLHGRYGPFLRPLHPSCHSVSPPARIVRAHRR